MVVIAGGRREEMTFHGRLASAVWLLAGVAVGAGGAVVAQVAPWPISLLPHYAAPYVLLLVLVGASAATLRAAAVNAAVCFLAFVLGYYSVVAVQFGAIPVVHAGAWLVAALTVCPLAAVVVHWSRSRPGLVQACVAAIAGAAALSDGTVGNLVFLASGRGDPTFAQPVLAIVDVLVAAAVIVVLTRRARARVLSIVLLVPFAAAATFIGGAAHFGPGPYL